MLSLRPSHARRYKDLIVLLAKHGGVGLLREAGFEEPEGTEAKEEAKERAEDLAADLEKMGPTYVKIGQLLSTRSDLLPQTTLDALSRLQDKVETAPFEEIREVLEEELGVDTDRAFESFDESPIAAASLGQVYSATLRGGRRVAVKVQRPGVRQRVQEDFEALRGLVELLDRHTAAGRRHGFETILEQFRRTLMEELDYRKEAAHLSAFRENLAEFRHLRVPRAYDDMTTSRVLVMEFVEGTQVGTLSPVVMTDVDGATLAEELSRAYLHQVLLHGLFHADPHPGNILLTREHRLALIDLGMVGRIRTELRHSLMRLILAVSEGEGDEVARVALELGERRVEFFDERRFISRISDLVATQHDSKLDELEVGTVMLELCRIGGQCGVRVPAELALLGKTFLNLDQVGRKLDPGFNPAASIRRNASELTTKQTGQRISAGKLFAAFLDSTELVQEAPSRVNKILANAAENKLKIGVEGLDERILLVGMQKISNRITVGLILAALIIGAGLVMRVETEFKLFGYPGLAMLFFLAAGLGGLGLVWSILRSDQADPDLD